MAAGLVCVHPTDTLPGLAFDPRRAEALARLFAIKSGKSRQGFVSLVADLDSACKFWQPLPGKWRLVLEEFWPGPLSVIWAASAAAPRTLVDSTGGLALRVPALAEGSQWLRDFLASADFPLPSTSVNRSGEQPVRSWDDARRFACEYAGTFAPDVEAVDAGAGQPSTLIRITDATSFVCVRAGALDPEKIGKRL